ncbi:hypothetical protein LCGC14_0186480 [marine sediment metagenome]|jgi:hypothetical protein|uniref:Uncharacterized protein n=2 Tax=root TaxID=1 RepID=A0ABY0SNW7_9RHOB|nr:hypothetical protein SAMN04488512_1175 [Sulfitobacter litoralis]
MRSRVALPSAAEPFRVIPLVPLLRDEGAFMGQVECPFFLNV